MKKKANTCGLCGKHISQSRVYCKQCSKHLESQDKDIWRGYA